MKREPLSVNLLLAALILALYLSVSIATLHRYGVTFDEPEHWVFGDRYLRFYLTGDWKLLDFSSVGWGPPQTWPVGPTLAALTAKLFSEHLKLAGQVTGYHLASILLFGALLSSVWLFLSVHAGRVTALLSCLALATHPRIWGDAHNNSEDIAHLVFYALTILAFLHGMITRKARWLFASGACWGLALGSKINAMSVPAVIAPALLPVLWDRSQRPRQIVRALAVYPAVAFAVLFLAWPYLWESPIDRLARVWSFVVWWGYAGPLTWQGAPALNVLITTPLPTLALALVGIATSGRTGRPLGRPATLTLLAWLVVPIVRSSLPGVLNYDVIRRFMEFAPALAIFAGIGGAWIIDRTACSASRVLQRTSWAIMLAVTAALLSPLISVWRYFPYENTYYNPLVGGLGGAQSLKLQDSTDYHLASFQEGVEWINAHAEPRSFLIVQHAPHLIQFYPLRKDIVPKKHLWMDDLTSNQRTVYLMYATRQPYDYNICLAEAFLEPQYEVRRGGGVLLRIYKLGADSHFAVNRNAFPAPKGFTVTRKRRRAIFRWEPAAAVDDVVGHILYYGKAAGQYDGTVCYRGGTNQWELFADVPQGTYYLSFSVLTRRAQESERAP
ncbi:MAG TPA: glycosyltransferase family 39 protein, partial [Candidatus Tectomicrobia bacterium]